MSDPWSVPVFRGYDVDANLFVDDEIDSGADDGDGDSGGGDDSDGGDGDSGDDSLWDIVQELRREVAQLKLDNKSLRDWAGAIVPFLNDLKDDVIRALNNSNK